MFLNKSFHAPGRLVSEEEARVSFRVCVVDGFSFPFAALGYHGTRIYLNANLKRRASVGEIYKAKGTVFE